MVAPALDGHDATECALSFGRWVLKQAGRDGFIGQLATISKSDRGFPKDGDPDAVRRRRGDIGAELDWASF